MWYNVDWNKLVLWLLPTFLRKPKIYALLTSAIWPIKQLHDDWLVFREENLYRLAHNGQTCYFRGALNDAFDNIDRRITIENGLAISPNFVYKVEENKHLYLGLQPIYLYSSADSRDGGVDFIVKVPGQIIREQSDRLIAEIEYYRQAGKRYKIEAI